MNLGLVIATYAAIGPVTDLHISNIQTAPDGYTRTAIVAGGSFPGPLIKGNKVRTPILSPVSALLIGSEVRVTISRSM